MADIFCQKDALLLLQNKFILLIGDSNTRALYNDLIYLLHNNDVVPPIVFRKHSIKGQNPPVCDVDVVVRKTEVKDATRHVKEVREYRGSHGVTVRFCFTTRVMGDQTLCQLSEIQRGDVPLPDVVVLNSCVWDITRWGAMQEETYKRQLVQLFTRLRLLLRPDALVVWTTTMPVAENLVRGGFVIRQLDFIQKNIRFMTLEANLFVAELCKLFCFDLLDLHYHLRFQLSRRCSDGIHWETHAMRHITCLLLTHIALSYDRTLPGLQATQYLRDAEAAVAESDEKDQCRLPAEVLTMVQNALESAADAGGNRLPRADVSKRAKKRCRRRVTDVNNDRRLEDRLEPLEEPASDYGRSQRSSIKRKLDDISPDPPVTTGKAIPSHSRPTVASKIEFVDYPEMDLKFTVGRHSAAEAACHNDRGATQSTSINDRSDLSFHLQSRQHYDFRPSMIQQPIMSPEQFFALQPNGVQQFNNPSMMHRNFPNSRYSFGVLPEYENRFRGNLDPRNLNQVFWFGGDGNGRRC